MTLNFDRITNIATGYVSYEVKDNRLHFDKCTKKQREFWYSQSESLGTRADTTTGVRLDFTTDSKHLRAVVSEHKFELRINGVVKFKTADGVIDTPLSGSDRVTIIFPSHERGYIESLELDDGATFTRYGYKTKMLFIGDSITQGWNSQYDGMSYAYRVSDFFDADSIINGIGGAYFAKDSFDKPDFDPDTVVVAYGCNDFKHYKTDDERAVNAYGFLSAVAKAYVGKRLFYVVPIMRRDVKDERRDEFMCTRSIFEKTAKELGFNIIDGVLAVPDVDIFYADDLHPNDLGFGCYAQHVIKKIQEAK